MKDGNYYTVYGWMINRLKLKGTTLQLYAVIYGFSENGENECSGSLAYLAETWMHQADGFECPEQA